MLFILGLLFNYSEIILINIIFRIACSSFHKIGLDILKIELLFEKIDYKVGVHTTFACVDIRADKSPLWKCMNANMAFGDSNDSRPTTRIFYIVGIGLKNRRRGEFLHTQQIG